MKTRRLATCVVVALVVLALPTNLRGQALTPAGGWPVSTKANGYWSPDGQALVSRKPSYDGCSPITAMAAYQGGVLAAFANVGCKTGAYKVLWTPDATQLGKGELRYEGCSPVTAMIPYKGGILTSFANAGCQAGRFAVVWSANGKNLGSGDVVYEGCSPVLAMTPFKGGVITAVGNVGCVANDNAAFWSKDGKNLGTGEIIYRGCSPITAIAPFKQGVLTAFAKTGCVDGQYAMLWSRDGKNLGGGEQLVKGVSPVIALAPFRGGMLAAFANVGGSSNLFRVEYVANNEFGAGQERYRGMSPVTALLPYKDGVATGVVQFERVQKEQVAVKDLGGGRFELGWANFFPCSKWEMVATSIPGVALPTLYTAEQRLYAFATMSTRNAPVDIVKECAAIAVGSCGLASLVAGPEACTPAFKTSLTSCLTSKVQDAAVNSVRLTVESKCMW